MIIKIITALIVYDTIKYYSKKLIMGKNYFHEKWDCYVGRKVRIHRSGRYEDLKDGATGTWQYKDVEAGMVAILIDGENQNRIFHIFEYSFV